ncbi:MAG: carboxylating nicotinate-nucleotide diphosphorylase [Chloroflexia bacterium]|jgi:nicotinate-nucleotide pyrophosphorylase (carboxylating)|nr:carboxylating nicotinate-nucleotide diphosphorylase [Chloroflexia bacterium]
MDSHDLPAATSGWRSLVELALAEDVGNGDITTLATVPETTTATGTLHAKEAGVLSGVDVAQAVFLIVDPEIDFESLKRNGDRIEVGDTIARLSGPARSLLTAERTALNIMQRLSGVATVTARYVEAVRGTRAQIVDTRKTTPGMRMLEKRAVLHGGGGNHRFGLADGVLIKDNHLAAIGGEHPVRDAVHAARCQAPHTMKIEVEVTTLDELAHAFSAQADIVLLDNMTTDMMAAAVRLRDERAPGTLLEASGGITLERIPEIAATGVDMISVGALTHSSRALDISLEFEVTH